MINHLRFFLTFIYIYVYIDRCVYVGCRRKTQSYFVSQFLKRHVLRQPIVVGKVFEHFDVVVREHRQLVHKRGKYSVTFVIRVVVVHAVQENNLIIRRELVIGNDSNR